MNAITIVWIEHGTEFVSSEDGRFDVWKSADPLRGDWVAVDAEHGCLWRFPTAEAARLWCERQAQAAAEKSRMRSESH